MGERLEKTDEILTANYANEEEEGINRRGRRGGRVVGCGLWEEVEGTELRHLANGGVIGNTGPQGSFCPSNCRLMRPAIIRPRRQS
jgi:hypothetical protein